MDTALLLPTIHGHVRRPQHEYLYENAQGSPTDPQAFSIRSYDSMNASTPLSARSQGAASGLQKGNAESQGSAVRGASLAFLTPSPTVKPLTNTYSGTNGALAAAYLAGTGQKRVDSSYNNEGKRFVTPSPRTKTLQTPSTGTFPQRSVLGSAETLELPTGSLERREQSPSYIAAALAAARSTPTPTGQDVARTKPIRPVSAHLSQAPQVESSPLPSASALVGLFEAKQHVDKQVKEPQRTISEVRPIPFIASPTPVRPVVSARMTRKPLILNHPFTDGGSDLKSQTADQSVASERAPDQRTTTRYDPKKTTSRPVAGVTPVAAFKVPPSLPPPRRNTHPPSTLSEIKKDEHGPASGIDGTPSIPDTPAKDAPLVSTESKRYVQKPSDNVSTRPLPVPIDRLSSMPYAIPPLARSQSSVRVNSRPSTRSPSSRLVPQLTADSLANAIVAGSLATSRAPSPTKQPPPAMPRRRSKTYSLFHHHDHSSRTPSPAKPLRQTLRAPEKSDPEDSRTRKPHPLKKHPNKHAEGDRKRWRDVIDEQEKKRYEGVWAANRGILLIPAPHSSDSTAITPESKDLVSNLVVRDIWSRSHLSFSTLAEVWDRVDLRGDGKLAREEFVVGTWLIDQCLKGKKIPVKVSESVWSSVRRLSGIKIP
ncbi:Increased rDNA silencing protein [Varicellaria rhodocarpa]|nr:Increased rDNA silencing protein [Varicellaria rhodocarpa]